MVSMTWSELIQHASQFAGNAEVRLEVFAGRTRENVRLSDVNGNGAYVCLSGRPDPVEGGGIR